MAASRPSVADKDQVDRPWCAARPANRRVGLPDIRKYGVPSSPRSRRSSAPPSTTSTAAGTSCFNLGPRLPLALRGPARQQPVETILHAAPDAAWCWCGPADCGAAVSATPPARPTSGPTCGGRSRVLKNLSSSRPSATSPSSWSSPPTSRGAGRNEINATDEFYNRRPAQHLVPYTAWEENGPRTLPEPEPVKRPLGRRGGPPARGNVKKYLRELSGHADFRDEDRSPTTWAWTAWPGPTCWSGWKRSSAFPAATWTACRRWAT